MAIKKYIGARYVPKFMGAWDKASEYAALSVVYANEQSYVSRKTVPANTEITNTEFWIKSADWNAQVTQYNQNVEQYQANVEQYNQNVETYNADVHDFFDATIHAYNTKEEMVNDTTIQLNYTLITCGATAVGDGGGSLYKVSSTTSATAVALNNGLFAVPFDFTLESDVGHFNGVTNTTTFVNGKRINTLSITAEQTNFNIRFPFLSKTDSAVIHVISANQFTLTVDDQYSAFGKQTYILGTGCYDLTFIVSTGFLGDAITMNITPATSISTATTFSMLLATTFTDYTPSNISNVSAVSNGTIINHNLGAGNSKIYFIHNNNTSAITITFSGGDNTASKAVSIDANSVYMVYVYLGDKGSAEKTPVMAKYIKMS